MEIMTDIWVVIKAMGQLIFSLLKTLFPVISNLSELPNIMLAEAIGVPVVVVAVFMAIIKN